MLMRAKISESSGDGFQTFELFNWDFHDNVFHNPGSQIDNAATLPFLPQVNLCYQGYPELVISLFSTLVHRS